eukprot:336627-Hanusia_phi.AAC.2
MSLPPPHARLVRQPRMPAPAAPRCAAVGGEAEAGRALMPGPQRREDVCETVADGVAVQLEPHQPLVAGHSVAETHR